jgi:hypothetical protein
MGRLRGRVAPIARRSRDRPRHPAPHYREIALRWTEALREAYQGRDAAEALRAAAADAERRFAATG